MFTFKIRKSVADEIVKSLGKDKLEKLKAEVISILKKKENGDLKKAIEFFEKDEERYTHLEKSLSGAWIEKAGYGVGTVRIWKGKKYKKVSTNPTRWVRVFDKHDRGAATSMGKYIAQVERCQSVEELYRFCMKQRSLFQDDNGVDLPIMDKLRAAIDEQSGKIERGEVNKPAENKNSKVLSNGKTVDEVREKYGIKVDKKENKSAGKKEPESEKHQNRSDAMKGNKNAYKGGSKDEPKDYSHMSQTELEKINTESFEKTKQGDDAAYEIHKQVRRQMDINDAKLPYKRLMSSLNSIEEKDKYLDEKISAVDAGIKKAQTSIKKTTDIRKRNAKVDLLHEYELNREALVQLKNDLYEERDSQKDTGKEKKSVEEIEREERHAKAELNNKVKTLVDENTKYNKKDVQSMLDRVHMTRYSPSAFDFDMQQASLDKDIEVMTDALKRQIQGEEVGQTQKRLLEIIKEDKAKKEAIDIARKEFENGKWKEVYRGAYEYQEETQDDKPVKDQKLSSNPYEPTETNEISEKTPIATNKSVGDKEVEMPYSKELANELKTLNNYADDNKSGTRTFMDSVYYKDGVLVATNDKRLKIVKVGKLEGIENEKYVDVTVTKDSIKIKQKDKEGLYPQYTRVIPNDTNQKITLDNKAVRNKIKSLKSEGAWTSKKPKITFDLKDGKLLLDGEIVGDAKGVTFDDKKTDNDFININANYILDALSGDTSNLMVSNNARKSVVIGTNSTMNILMPMDNETRAAYDEGRNSKKESDNSKARIKEYRQKELNEALDNHQKNFKPETVEKLIKAVNDKEMKGHENIIKNTYESMIKAEKQLENPTSSYLSEMQNPYGLRLIAASRINPEFRTALVNMAKEYGMEIKKSIFDFIDFEVDDSEDESYSDYDASQSELFNSTSYKVGAALDSIFGC